MICDVRGEHAFRISSQGHSDPAELTLVYGHFKQKTCLYMLFQLNISLRPQPNVYQ